MESAKLPDYLPHNLLFAAKNGDRDALAQLVSLNEGLVRSIALRFLPRVSGRCIDLDDLIQLGQMGLLKAIANFEPNFGTRFSTYAVPKITGEIRRFLRDDGIIKVSRGLKEQSAKAAAARETLLARLGREPTLSELSEFTGLEAEELAAAGRSALAVESLDACGDDENPLENLLGRREEPEILDRLALAEAMKELSERERRVIDLRYFRGLTQQKTAKILNISQVSVSRTETRSLDKMRIFLEKR